MSALNSLREQLVELQQELQARLTHIQQEQIERSSLDQQLWSDQGTLHGRDDEQFALKVAAEAELQHIQNALIRIDQGTYGLCTICGEAIEPQRLQALPFAARCMQHVGLP